jgi:2-oxoglutarate ferredoxin oxidoreductase subunit alpha
MRINILIGGSAGHGINTIDQFLTRLLTKKGFHFHSYKDYMSRIRGGTNFTHVTLSDQPVHCHDDALDVIVALTSEIIKEHYDRLTDNGLIICDADVVLPEPCRHQVTRLNFKAILKETGNSKGYSMVALGAIVKAIGLEESTLNHLVDKRWTEAIIDANTKTARMAYEATHCILTSIPKTNEDHLVMSGNQAVALGALAAGVGFYSAYPMAPSTGVMSYLTQYETRYPIVVEQAEDEIAAINSIIGAASNGLRSMTSTSGGGFSLMVEGLGFAAVAEVPVVMLDVQRPGPATGMATRTEQSDLNFVLDASQGEFPRMILSFNSIEDAFYKTFRAFNLADKYRVPVILLSDQYLADSTSTVREPDLKSLTIDLHLVKEVREDYRHHDLRTLVQDRVVPGMTSQIVMNDSHEHDENGGVTESASNRTAMNDRRMSKLNEIIKEMEEPRLIGDPDAKDILICWGSTAGVVEAAVETLTGQGRAIGALIFGDLYPLPTKTLTRLIERGARLINVEGNYQGQLRQLISRELAHPIHHSILKYDGRQFSPGYILKAYEEMIQK